MLQTRLRLFPDARGSVASITGLLLFALMGFVGFMYDVGHWYSERQKLQVASDMAALGAAQAASNGTASAFVNAVAHHDAALNGFDSTEPATEINVVIKAARWKSP